MERRAAAASSYVQLEQIGEGGMGVVHRGRVIGPAGERLVAMKRLGVRREPADLARLIAEARLVFQLTHGNICQVIDIAATEDATFMVMEYVEGLDLAALMRSLKRGRERFEPACAIYVAREIARALGYAHRRADDAGRPLLLVHGDVTPRNILLSVEGEVKLADFGIARALGVAAPGTSIEAGTPGYRLPANGSRTLDQRVDLYALGINLHVMLTGHKPAAPGVLDDAALDQLAAKTGPRLAELIGRTGAHGCENRFARASEVEAALAEELSRIDPGFTPARLGEIVRRHRAVPREAGAQGGAGLVGQTARSVFEADTVRVGSHGSPSPETSPRVRTRTSRLSARTWPRWVGAAAIAAIATSVWLTVGREPGAAAVGGAAAVARAGALPAAAASAADPRVPEAAAPSLDQSPPPIAAAPSLDQPAVGSPAVALPAPPANRAQPSRHAPPGRRSLRAVAAPPAQLGGDGFLTVTASPWGAVYVDGRRVSEQTPVYRLPLRKGRHRVKLFYPSRAEYSTEREVVVDPSVVRSVVFTSEGRS